ncbi:MAG: glucose-1-phosphate adenylyltransferase subunit GlgD [Gammaproteobacteria bacterium]|nr:glucose-1-phosphate adenylyltransferase subunit GlgD [Gammaproteobacteria bacterium]
METLALILAGGRGSRLDILSEKRVKPSVPFAGKFRIIDFALSNCSNSGIYNVYVLTQYLPLSLNEHVGSGKPWDMDRRDSHITLLQPHSDWYNGTADSLRKNIHILEETNCKYVLILSGDHVYKMDYSKMIDFHKQNGAKLTIACKVVPLDEAKRFGIMEADENGLVYNFVEKPKEPKSDLASMGIYVFDKDLLLKMLKENDDIEDLDFGKHIIPELIGSKTVYAYKFYDYWKDVGTYDSYLESNIELIETVDKIQLDMYDPNWKIYTKSEDLPAVKIGSKAKISQALLSNGSIIAGNVKRSVISPGVVVYPNATVENSVILNNTVIKEGAVVKNAIIDKDVVIEEGAIVGDGENRPNEERPDLLSSGISVIGKGSKVPKDMHIGKNVRIFGNINLADLNLKEVKSGSTIKN